MNVSVRPEPEHQAYICLGSNIDPVVNLGKAINMLRQKTRLVELSTCWESEAIGSPGPNFLNIGVAVTTPLGPGELKEQVLAPIEKQLGRVRSAGFGSGGGGTVGSDKGALPVPGLNWSIRNRTLPTRSPRSLVKEDRDCTK